MKLVAIVVIVACVALNLVLLQHNGIGAATKPDMNQDKQLLVDQPAPASGTRMAPPRVYRGIYLHNHSARTLSILKRFIRQARKSHVNMFVLDLQDAVYFRSYPVPRAHVALCISNNIYPAARIVVFPYGLKRYPVPASHFRKILGLARKAAEAGFPEVQFDYIRFEDSGRLRWVSMKKRYALVEGFLARARAMLDQYGVRTSADVFGRVALNRGDRIGQRLEGLDKVVDLICPMVYPSHFSWSRFMMANPYYTVYKSAVTARDRLRRAGLLMYIQGFVMKVGYSGLSLQSYIAHQIKASEDARIQGYIVWNAAQRYQPTFAAMRRYYGGQAIPRLKRATDSARSRVDRTRPGRRTRDKRRAVAAKKQDKSVLDRSVTVSPRPKQRQQHSVFDD